MTLRFSPARGAGSLSLYSVTRGPDGPAATVTVNTTTTLTAGSSATVVNEGDTSAAIFDFGIPRGADAGPRYTYDSTTSMADPGSGKIRFNNATVGSISQVAISAIDADANNIRTWITSWDDSGHTPKATLIIRKGGTGTMVTLAFNGTVTDNTTWIQIPVTSGVGAALTNADVVFVTPLISGSDGSMSGPGVSVDSEIALFSGTGGSTLKRASASGIARITSGVLSASKVALTEPATAATVTITDNKTLSVSNTMTLAATDGQTWTFPASSSNVLTTGNTATITKGYTLTPYNGGTVSSGTYTPDASNGNYQYYTNGGAHTLAVPAADCAIEILVTNNGSAGTITISGSYTVSSNVGDALTTTNTSKFIISIRRINSVSTYLIKALQ
jgi:hypothetical protein